MSIYSNKDTTHIQTPNTDVFGNLLVRGNLTVNGQSSTVNSTIVAVSDLAIELAKDATNANEADGGGIIINGADARIEYSATEDQWTFNKDIETRALFIEDLTFTGTGPVNIASGNDLYFNSPGLIRSLSRDFTVEASDSIIVRAVNDLLVDSKDMQVMGENIALNAVANIDIGSNKTTLVANELAVNIQGIITITGNTSVTLGSDDIVLNGASTKINSASLTVNSNTFSVDAVQVVHIESGDVITLESVQYINVNSATVNLNAVDLVKLAAADIVLSGPTATTNATVTINDYTMPASKGQLEQVLTADGANGEQAQWKSLSTVAWSGSYTDLSDLPDLTIYATTQALLNSVAAETTRATAEEGLNAAAVATETITRANADTTLQSNIDAEATARTNADAVLQSNIDSKISLLDLKDIAAASTDFADFQSRIAGL